MRSIMCGTISITMLVDGIRRKHLYAGNKPGVQKEKAGILFKQNVRLFLLTKTVSKQCRKRIPVSVRKRLFTGFVTRKELL